MERDKDSGSVYWPFVAQVLDVRIQWLYFGEGPMFEHADLSLAEREWLRLGNSLSQERRQALRELVEYP